MKKRVLAALMVAAMTASLATGCGTPAGKSSDSDDGGSESGVKRVTYSLREEPPSMDPQKGNSISTATACDAICEGLVRNVSGEVRPAGAESWEVSDDGLVYTFHIREGMKWSDGEPLTAEDYAYGFTRLMDPAEASDYAFFGYVLKNGVAVNNGEVPVEELGVKVVDDMTLELTLEYPASYFLGMCGNTSFAPARKDLVEKYGKEYSADPEKAAYSGPFTMSEWKHGDELVLAKNEEYWDKDSIKLDEICIKTVADAKTAVAMWESGDLDITVVPTEMSEQYADQSNFYYTGAVDYLMMNESEGRPFANKNLRLAVSYSLDRKEYNTLVNNDVYDVQQRLVFPMVSGSEEGKTYGDEYPLEAFPATKDEAKAKEYLEAAMSEMGVSDPSEIEIEFLTTDTDGAKKQAEVFQEQIQKALGIKVTIKQTTYKQRLELETNLDYDVVSTGWVPDYSDPYSYLELWISDGQYNHSGYNNPEYDKLLEESRTETDPKVRMDKLFAAEKLFLEEAGVAPFQKRRDQYLVNPKLKDFNVYFVGHDFELVYADIEE